MLRFVVVITIAGLAVAAAAEPATRAVMPGRAGSGLCRHAPPLAALPPEQVQQGRPDPRRGGRGDVPPAMVGMPTPVALAAPPPPPPPPPAAGLTADAASSIVVTGSKLSDKARAEPETGAETRAADTDDARAFMPPRRPGPQPQAGILTAGEHDDLLNPELYARYVRASNLGQRWRALPRVDTGRALTIAVTDAAGRGVPLADVVLTCADGNTLSLATMADGTAVFFPALDRLGASVRVSVRARGQALSADRTVAIPDAPGPQRIAITTAGRAAPVAKFDLLLMVDTTGSMGDEIDYLKAELRGVLASLKAAHPGLDLRVGLLFYRDVGDDYVTRSFAFAPDFDRAQALVRQQSADGGGDLPEAVDQAMNRAVHFGWRPDAIKSMLFVADAPPHDELVGKAWAAAEVTRAKRIQIVPVAASGVDDAAEYIMRAMAAATQSRYLFLTDDSGVGNPHAPPAIDCYLVTKLDAAVRRVLDSQISGRRIEPGAGEVIRTVGQYDAGRCVLPRGQAL